MPTRVVAPGVDREAQLGADSVGSRYQHRLAIAVERHLDQRAEAADAAQHFAAHRAPDARLDSLDKFVAGVDVDSGVAIGYGRSLSHSDPSMVPAGRADAGRAVGQLWYFTSGNSRLRDYTMAQYFSVISSIFASGSDSVLERRLPLPGRREPCA